MPNPKWRHSKRRKRARRTHDKAEMPTLGSCKTTGETHRLHRAYSVEGAIYYRGHVLVPARESGVVQE